MTDRSSTEEKVNKNLNESSSQECNSFKCFVHPLLQFSDTCKKELTVMEQELKIKDIDDQKKRNIVLLRIFCGRYQNFFTKMAQAIRYMYQHI